MRNLIYSAATSLDGFIALPPPSYSTSWIQPTPSIDFRALYARFDGFVMGRRTFEAVTSDPEHNYLRERMKDGDVEVVVLSRTLSLSVAEVQGVTVLRDGRDVAAYIRGMKEREGKGIWVMGGGWVAGECLRGGLLDVVEVAVMPVVLGKGVKMVEMLGEEEEGEGEKWWKLRLKGVERLEGEGVVMMGYDVVYDGEREG